MKTFSFSDLNRQAGDVFDAALAAPITLTKRGKPKLVVMPIALFEALADGTRSYHVDDAPDAINDLVLSAAEDALAD
jgi:prevent-host-death family protein